MDFLDQTHLRVRSGSGGVGCVSFRREKNVPRGGPDGGDGGKGGDIWAEAVTGITTLAQYRRVRKAQAGDGRRGSSRNRTGASGADRTLRLPVGTVLIDRASGTVIADLAREGDRVLLGEGGAGGTGNARFATSVNRAPRRATPGCPGVEYELELRLKLLADAGLVGLPNAGKSTMLRAVSNARPKVADYPFTTLYPFLGTVELDHEGFVLADIPGLIEGAHRGVGLGDRFLRHVERCAVLLHLVDATADDVAADYHAVVTELAAYDGDLERKPRLVALSKIDVVSADEVASKSASLRAVAGVDVHAFSGVAGTGIPPILRQLRETILQERQ